MWCQRCHPLPATVDTVEADPTTTTAGVVDNSLAVGVEPATGTRSAHDAPNRSPLASRHATIAPWRPPGQGNRAESQRLAERQLAQPGPTRMLQ